MATGRVTLEDTHQALKLMHLLIATAGGRMADDVRDELRLASIKSVTGMQNHSRATLRKLCIALAGAVRVFDDTDAQCEIIGGFLDRAKLDCRDEATAAGCNEYRKNLCHLV